MAEILEKWQVMPHDPLTGIDDGILSVAGEIHMPLGIFPRRMTVVRLSGGRTAIYSAIALDEPEMARIELLGRPSFLIVPSDGHRMDAKIWKDRYPDILVLTPPGARTAVAEVLAVDATDDVLGDPDVDFLTVPGTGGHESALAVRRAGGTTIICNDVIGNVAHPKGIGAQIMGRLMGFGVTHPQVPRVIRHKIIDDETALADQFEDWAADPALRRIIVSHGDIIDQEPAAVLLALAKDLCG
jgi:hypothetical protein